MSTPRVRIPPGPSGSPHVGTARMALFNYLFAKRYAGTLVLRIEDTDRERSKKIYEEEIFEALHWLGIDTDENPEIGGPYAPYRQSERNHIYRPSLDRLLKEGIAFYCFHTKDELEQERSRMIAEKKSPLHRCEYRETSVADAHKLFASKQESVIRFKVPLGRTIQFSDLIRGDIIFETDVIEDFSIARNLDGALYNFAVTIDDAVMKISHVIRGEDLIASTPKQILLAQALGFPIPKFAHLPLILGTDRSKLSKRHGAMSVLEYRKLGYLPEALFNFIALLGWHPKDDREIMSKEEIIAEFSIEKIQKSGAIFDFQKLDWMNGKYIREKPPDDLVLLCTPFISDFLQMPLPDNRFSNEYIEKVVALEQPRLKKLSEIGERVDYFFREPAYEKELLRWKNMNDQQILNSLMLSEQKLNIFFSDGKDKFLLETQVKRTMSVKIGGAELGGGGLGPLLWPLRVALSGKRASPDPFDIMKVLGIEESLKRIQAAKERVRSQAS